MNLSEFIIIVKFIYILKINNYINNLNIVMRDITFCILGSTVFNL